MANQPQNPLPLEQGGMSLLKQGAEARIFTSVFYGKPTIIKERFTKGYRHPVLDKKLTTQRTKSEVRAAVRCRTIGIPTPAIYFVDLNSFKIYMEHITDSVTVRDYIIQVQMKNKSSSQELLEPLMAKIGSTLGKMHKNNIIHGDLTTSNMLLKNPPEKLDLVMIDFGLSYIESLPEDKGVDLYVLERAFLSTHPNTEQLFESLLQSYKVGYGKGFADVINKLDEVRLRGRKRSMVG